MLPSAFFEIIRSAPRKFLLYPTLKQVEHTKTDLRYVVMKMSGSGQVDRWFDEEQAEDRERALQYCRDRLALSDLKPGNGKDMTRECGL
jgi:hypothetical protein